MTAALTGGMSDPGLHSTAMEAPQAQGQEPFPLLDLPTPAIVHVLRSVPLTSLFRLASTCKFVRDLVADGLPSSVLPSAALCDGELDFSLSTISAIVATGGDWRRAVHARKQLLARSGSPPPPLGVIVRAPPHTATGLIVASTDDSSWVAAAQQQPPSVHGAPKPLSAACRDVQPSSVVYAAQRNSATSNCQTLAAGPYLVVARHGCCDIDVLDLRCVVGDSAGDGGPGAPASSSRPAPPPQRRQLRGHMRPVRALALDPEDANTLVRGGEGGSWALGARGGHTGSSSSETGS